MDRGLDGFLDAADGDASALLLAGLIESCIEPIINASIRGKLHVSLQTRDKRQINQDAIDLVSEVKTLIIAKLTKLKSGNGHARIDNLETCTNASARNRCKDQSSQRSRGPSFFSDDLT